jgi:acetyl esterase/lipase
MATMGAGQSESGKCSFTEGGPGSRGSERIPYKTEPFAIYLDQYDPLGPQPAEGYPALILIHGGAWKTGCRRLIDREAHRAQVEGFVVFSIDYRLACSVLSPPGDPEIARLCGFHGQEPVDDVLAAVQWVRAHGGDFGYALNPRKVAALGFSAGGHLAFMAGVAGIADATRPDAVAGWSGPPQLAYLANGDIACSAPYSWNPSRCQTAFQRYVSSSGCSLTACPEKYSSVSPHTIVSQVCTPLCDRPPAPPIFVANAISELVPYQGGVEFMTLLSGLTVRTNGFRVTSWMCSVAGTDASPHPHATGYENQVCGEDTTLTVWDRTMTFMKSALGLPLSMPALSPVGNGA